MNKAPPHEKQVNRMQGVPCALRQGPRDSGEGWLVSLAKWKQRKEFQVKGTAWAKASRWLSGEVSACQCRRCGRLRFDPWVRKMPWRRKWQPTPVFLPGKSHGHRSLVGYSPWGHKKELDMTERLNNNNMSLIYCKIKIGTHGLSKNFFFLICSLIYRLRFMETYKLNCIFGRVQLYGIPILFPIKVMHKIQKCSLICMSP